MAPSMRRGRGLNRRRNTEQHYTRRLPYKSREMKRLNSGYARRSPAKIPRFKGHRHNRLYQQPYFRDSSESSEILEDGLTPRAGSMKNRIDVIDVGSSSDRGSSPNSSVSTSFTEAASAVNSVNCTMALLKKKSLVQIINNYIRAGIEEGKRRAKQYIRKALSFGVKSGYLIPADQQGQVLHVSPALVSGEKVRDKERDKERESRKKRRRARRGEEEVDVLERKALRRGISPRVVKNKKLRDVSEDVVSPVKKKRKEPKARKANSDARQNTRKASLEIPRLQDEGIKSKRGRQKKSKKVTDKPSASSRCPRPQSKRPSRSLTRKSAAERNRNVSSANKDREGSASRRDRETEGRKEENSADLEPANEGAELPRVPFDVSRIPDEEKDSQEDDEEVRCGAEGNDEEMWPNNTVECAGEASGNA